MLLFYEKNGIIVSMSILKIPLSVVNGSFKKLESSSLQAKAQIVAFASKTSNGELPLEPTFGIVDPTFDVNNVIQTRAIISQFWPEIVIGEFVVGKPTKDGSLSVSISIER